MQRNWGDQLVQYLVGTSPPKTVHRNSSCSLSSKMTDFVCEFCLWVHKSNLFFKNPEMRSSLIFLNMGLSRSLFIYYLSFHVTIQVQIQKAQMLCLGFEPGATGWQVQTDPLCYGVHNSLNYFQIQKMWFHFVRKQSKKLFSANSFWTVFSLTNEVSLNQLPSNNHNSKNSVYSCCVYCSNIYHCTYQYSKTIAHKYNKI